MKPIILALLLLLVGQSALCSTLVKVGGYMFPPFVETSSGSPKGLTIDLIKLLNESQSEFEFKFVLTSPKRRYHDFKRNAVDAMFFESKQWGWQGYPISASEVFLKGGEVYITKNNLKKKQTYFDQLNDKKLVGILGYHYQFAGFESDEHILKQQFNIQLVNHPNTIINQVLSGQADIGIVTRSYLAKAERDHPTYKETILTSSKLDQMYAHTILVRDHFPLNLNKINTLLKRISKQGSLDKLLLKYGLDRNL
jgi:polar amino acid transport system substrate-binding protein